ncbi:tripartite tricarboxylate transporter TctB family protein [Thalassobaculum sp.]|uniref:tripartite tricarboxylate transporter TctB family protein n=1 Tax=Thalassobaculum sp. TaxID=2022740 RepID=UPI0032ED12F2
MTEARPRLPGERAFSLVLLAFSLFVLYQAYRISGFSSVSSPGVFPMLAALVMVGSLVVTLLQERKLPTPSGSGPMAFYRRVTPPVLLIMVALIVALMLMMEPAGFVVAAGGFLFASILILQGGRPVRAAVISAGALAAIYAVFRLVFQVVLPEAEWL